MQQGQLALSMMTPEERKAKKKHRYEVWKTVKMSQDAIVAAEKEAERVAEEAAKRKAARERAQAIKKQKARERWFKAIDAVLKALRILGPSIPDGLDEAHRLAMLRALVGAYIGVVHKDLNPALGRRRNGGGGKTIDDVKVVEPMLPSYDTIDGTLRAMRAYILSEYKKMRLHPVKDAVDGGTQVWVETEAAKLALPSCAEITLRATTTPSKARDRMVIDGGKNKLGAITWTLCVSKRGESPERDVVISALVEAGFYESGGKAQPKVETELGIKYVLNALWNNLTPEQQQANPPPPPKRPKYPKWKLVAHDAVLKAKANAASDSSDEEDK